MTLFAKLRAEGFHSVAARIPEDRLPADDQRTVAVRAIKEVKVLLVDGEPGNEPRDSEVFFLKNALVPVPPEAAAEYFIKATRHHRAGTVAGAPGRLRCRGAGQRAGFFRSDAQGHAKATCAAAAG